jgi:hypothetical protein
MVSPSLLGVIGDKNPMTIPKGPVPVAPTTQALKKRKSEFQHPGPWHCHIDLELEWERTYDPSFYRCEAILVNGPWANISAENRDIG